MGAVLTVALAAAGGGIAEAKTCTFEPEPSPFFAITVTNTTCAKAQKLGNAWAEKSSCHSSVEDPKARCKLRKFTCNSRITNTGSAAYEKVKCRKGEATVKFSYGFG